MTVAEAHSALKRAVHAHNGVCTHFQVRREIVALHGAILERPRKPMELWEPEAFAKFYITKERRIKKLRSRNGKCVVCKLLIMDCKCLATVAEYQSIEAGNVHITRSRLDGSMDRALDLDVQIMHRAIDEVFVGWILEAEQRLANDPDAYYGAW